MNFYTYIYLDPRKPGCYEYGNYTFDYEPFYVGKGKNDQLKSHLYEANTYDFPKKYMNAHKFYKIKNILNENLEPIILEVEKNLTEKESFNLEIWLIWSVGRSDSKIGSLSNHTDGGDGSCGLIHSEESKRKQSEKMKGKPSGMKGKISWNKGMVMGPLSEEHKNKLSKANKGKHPSEESNKKRSESNKGKLRSKETKQKMRKPKSEEHKKKMSEVAKGRTHTEETKKKMSKSHRKEKCI